MRADSEKFDVIISGAGNSGLALAIALGHAFAGNIRIAVVGSDPRRQLAAETSRAFALSAASKSLLEALGVWSRIQPEAQPVLRIELTDSPLEAGVRPVLLTYDNKTSAGKPASYIVPASALFTALSAAVENDSNSELFRDRSVIRFLGREAMAQVTLDDEQSLSASLVVAADGLTSAARESADIGTVGWRHRQTGIVVTVEHEKPHGGCAVQHFLPAGPFAILPLVGNRSCITWSEDEVEAERIMALPDDDFLDQVDQRFGGKLGELRLAGPRQSFALTTQLARRYVEPRFALLGDAAHNVHPIAGQGLNLALRDVAALTECIADGARVGLDIGDMTVLERYEKWRRFDATLSAGTYDAINRLFAVDWPLLRSVREAGLGLVDQMPGIKGLLISEAAGLTGELPMLLRGESVRIC
ncbi:MAG: FAD-dependent monooxygenase [Hyphomicrobiaceae bacterium]